MRRPRPLVRLVGIGLALAVVVAGCGSEDQQEPTGTPPTTATPSPAQATDLGDVAALVSVVEAGFDATDDPFTALAPITGLPGGFPVPTDPVLTTLVVSARAEEAGVRVEASVRLWTPAAPDDVATLYRTALPALGFELTGGKDPERVDRTQFLDFTAPASGATIWMNAFDVTAAVEDDRVTSPTEGTDVTVSHTFSNGDETLERLSGWATGVPIDVEATEDVALSTGDFEPRDRIQMSATLRVAGGADAVQDAIAGGLADVVPVAPEHLMPDETGVVGTTAEGRRTSYIVSPVTGEEGKSEVKAATCIPLQLDRDDRRVQSQYIARSPCEEFAALTASAVDEPLADETAEMAPIAGHPATIDELTAAVADALGPTDDMVADLAPFVTLPNGVSTPTGASVDEFDVYIDRANVQFGSRADITLRTSGSIADLATFFEATLTAAGYTSLGTTIENEGASTEQRTLGFTEEDGGFDDVAEITIFIGDAYAQEPTASGTPARLSIAEVDQGRLAATAWGLPLPGIDAASARSWRIGASAEPAFATGVPQVQLTTSYDAADPTAIIDGIRAGPPEGASVAEVQLDPENVWLDRPGFESFWVQPADDEGEAPAVDVVGTVPFELDG